MVDKSLETEREITLEFDMDIPNNNIVNNNFETNATDGKHDKILDNLLEEKKAADLADKVRFILR